MPIGEPQLPADLLIGTATSSWQIEGSVGTRGRCIWDDFADRPGAIRDGATGEPACDHVARWRDDLELLSWLGVDAYRFSICWPRVQPGGAGQLDDSGLDFYDRLIDGLLERGIKPVATLYHWDLPSGMDWRDRSTAERFADYADAMASRYADRVDRWATLNEPWVSAFLGYAAGIHAPGAVDPQGSLTAAAHLMLGHGLAMQALRAHSAANPGIVLNLTPVLAETDGARAAADYVDALQNRLFLDLLAGRGVPAVLREDPRIDWSCLRPGDDEVISTPIDWLGENYYTVMRVGEPGAEASAVGQDSSAFPFAPPFAMAPRQPQTAMGWEVYPPGLIAALRMAADALPGVPLMVTENGAAYEDALVDGVVDDPDRVDYYRTHIAALLQARDDGIDVRGYFAWSMLDNIEWAEGWTKRFGIVRVDPDDQRRYPKASAHWWRQRIAERG